MTDSKQVLADLPVGFRVGPDGGVEAPTWREVDVLIARVIREAIEAGLSGPARRCIGATTR